MSVDLAGSHLMAGEAQMARLSPAAGLSHSAGCVAGAPDRPAKGLGRYCFCPGAPADAGPGFFPAAV